MSVSGPSPLGTLMVQRVEAALGATGAQQANLVTGARPDAVTQPGQPDKVDPAQNPPPKEQEGSRQAQAQGRQLAALARNDPEIARLLAARNAPMTGYTASAPTSLGQAAKTILALLQQFPDARPAVSGRAPLLSHSPAQGGQTGAGQGTGTAPGSPPASAQPVGGNLDPRSVQALMARAAGGEGGQQTTPQPGAQSGGTQQAAAAQAGQAAPQPANAGTQQTAASAARAATIGQQTALPGRPAAPAMAAAGPALSPSSLFLAPNSLAGQLATALSQAMQSSGLFYESHLREFAFGQRPLAQVQTEPQAQAGREATSGTQQNPAAQAQARGSAEPSAQAPGQGGSSNQAQPSSQAAAPAHAATAAQAGTQLAGVLLGMDPATHVLVRQQLEVLANQSFAWQGEAWPGGDLEWEVQRRDPQGGGEETESWSTQLKLQLPGLGEIRARLSLASNQLIMHLAAPESAGVIADHTGVLRERLGVHGLQLSQLTISRETTVEQGPKI